MFNNNKRLNPRLPYILSGFFFILFWYFRSVKVFEGSGDLWMREVEAGVWFRKRRMLSFLVFQLTYKIMNPLFHWNGRWVINLVSCLAGAIFVFFLYKICSRWKKGWIPFLLVMSSGMATLFYGFIETYSMVIAATAVFFYYLFEYLDYKRDALYPAFFYSLAAGFHLQVGFLFPVLPLAWYLRGHKWKEGISFAEGLAPCLLLIFAIRYFNVGAGDFFENIHWVTFSPQPNSVEPYTLFSLAHLKDFAWFQYRIALIALPCLFMLPFIVKKGVWKEPVVQILLVASIGLLALNFFHYTNRDLTVWTVFSIFGFPSLLLIGYLLTQVKFGKEIGIVLTAISLFVSVPYIIDHAQLGHRKEGMILVKDISPNTLVILDGYGKSSVIYHVLEGSHELKIIESPQHFEKTIMVSPYSTITIESWRP